MIDHIWTVVCSQVIIDSEAHNLSLINVIEQLNIKGLPVPGRSIPIHLELASFWVREDAMLPCNGNARFSFIAPSGKVMAQIEPQIVDLTKVERLRSRMILEALPLEENGRHLFIVELKTDDDKEWHQVSKVPLMIIFNPQELKQEEGG